MPGEGKRHADPQCWASHPARPPALPQGLADHVLVGDAVVGERLVPGGVQRVAQRFGSQLIRLEQQRGRAVSGTRPQGAVWALMATEGAEKAAQLGGKETIGAVTPLPQHHHPSGPRQGARIQPNRSDRRRDRATATHGSICKATRPRTRFAGKRHLNGSLGRAQPENGDFINAAGEREGGGKDFSGSLKNTNFLFWLFVCIPDPSTAPVPA